MHDGHANDGVHMYHFHITIYKIAWSYRISKKKLIIQTNIKN